MRYYCTFIEWNHNFRYEIGHSFSSSHVVLDNEVKYVEQKESAERIDHRMRSLTA